MANGTLKENTGLVLSGGGARGAYEAGVLYHLRKNIWPDRHGFQIHSGTSAGALNSAFLAATADRPEMQGEAIRSIWQQLEAAHIYRNDFRAVLSFIRRTLVYAASHLFRFSPFVKKMAGPVIPFRGVLDTAPFIPFLKKAIPFANIRRNIEAGHISAIALAATNVGSTRLELFIDKNETIRYSGRYRARFGPIDFSHALASAALPMIFPPVRIGPHFYMDGGLRQNTPMSPAIQLGADRVFIIGVKYRPSEETSGKYRLMEPNAYPTFTHMTGQLMSALFLDHIEYDMEQMNRINRIITWAEKTYGEDFLGKINGMLAESGDTGDIATRGLKKIGAFSLFPSEDFGKIACTRLLELSRSKRNLNPVERFFLKFMEIDPSANLDLLSYVMFEKKYLQTLIDIGIRDCRAREEEVARFLESS